jgi:hypothetical protein
MDGDALYERHKKRVQRRAKFLETLTPKQRVTWDNHRAYIKWWRKEYAKLSQALHNNKLFVRTSGHNNLATLKNTMSAIRKQQLRARTMMMARMAVIVDYEMKMEGTK